LTIPRLEQEQLPPNVAAMLAPRIKRLGYLGEFFKCAAHQPDALVSFMAFTEDLKHALPDRITEVVALTVSTALENAYERHQHERLCLKLGFGEEWIRAVEDRARDATHGDDRSAKLSAEREHERLVQDLTLAVLHRHGKHTTRELDAASAAIGHEQAIGVLMLIGRYVTHALMVNALDLAPPVPSPMG